jgi:maltose/maltodextrin transport system substrate-binding protein
MKNEILLVEDDSSLAAALSEVLQLAGYSVTLAATGEEGLGRASEHRYCTVLTDFKLPGLNGLDLVKEVHAANRRVPIILMTAHGTSREASEPRSNTDIGHMAHTLRKEASFYMRTRVLSGDLGISVATAIGLFTLFLALFLIPTNLFAWTNGELLIWMDSARAQGLRLTAKKFEKDLGIKVTIETPSNITNDFPISAQAGQGPDIVVWAHDKVGEWADGGLIAPVEVSNEFVKRFFPNAWRAVRHQEWLWGYPIALETVTLIYNKRLLEGPPPKQLSELVSINKAIKEMHPGVTAILWDYNSAYYSWGILASTGGYVFGDGKDGAYFNVGNVGVANPGAVRGLSQIIALVRPGILPPYVSYSDVEAMMAQGKVAMIISGPWAWANLIASGIDFGLAPMPGVGGMPAHPFVGISVAYVNRSSPNTNLVPYFIEHYLLTDEGLSAMNQEKPIGVPALISLYQRWSKKDPLVRQLNAAVNLGQVMPNIPEMGRFFSSVGAALQVATQGRASPQQALSNAAAAMRNQ